LHINYAPPRLLDVRIGGHSSVPLSSALCPLLSYLPRLVSLSLDICLYVSTLNSFAISCVYVYMVLSIVLSSLVCSFQDNSEVPKFQTLTNLRYLKWRIAIHDRESLVGLISMIEAAPMLHKFTLEVIVLTSHFHVLPLEHTNSFYSLI